METWWGLEEAMDLLSTSRRLTLRASRVSSVVSRWPLDLDSTARSSTTSRLLQSRFRQPLRTSNLQPRVVTERRTEFKGSETESRAHQTAAECDELKSKLRNVQEENVKLQAVITDLTQVNKRWQKYNNDRQIYVQKLLNTIQDQQEQLNKMGEQRAFSGSEVKSENTNTDSSRSSLENVVSRLHESERRLKEKIEVLEFQVKANRDDWEAENNEKKQAIKEKEEIEQRVNLLMDELQEVKQSVIEKRLPKDFITICQSCQAQCIQNSQIADAFSVHTKLYRTAVHLPCSSQQWNERSLPHNSQHATLTELALDDNIDNENDKNGHRNKINRNEETLKKLDLMSKDKRLEASCSGSTICSYLSNTDNCDPTKNVTNIWNIGRSTSATDSSVSKQDLGTSYSRASTVPLVSSPICKQMITPSNSSSTSSVALTTGSLNDEPVKYDFSTNPGTTVTSFVQIPIVKSSSAPDSKSDNCSRKSFRSSLDSFNMFSPTPPVTVINSPNGLESGTRYNNTTNDDGVETLTKEDIICPGCGTIFPPKTHLKFLDHFESCQRIHL